MTVLSKDAKLKAILREVVIDAKSKQFIEIWDKQHLIKSYDLSAFDVHGDVYSDCNTRFKYQKSVSLQHIILDI